MCVASTNHSRAVSRSRGVFADITFEQCLREFANSMQQSSYVSGCLVAVFSQSSCVGGCLVAMLSQSSCVGGCLIAMRYNG